MRQQALEKVYSLARLDSRVIFVGSDLGHGTLKAMREELPNQFVMEGISEQYIVGFVAGLAKEGYIPFVNTIANFFTRRAFEQMAMDVALHSLPVRFLATGGGMVYAPLGPTHTAVDDLSLMWCIPNMRVFCPADPSEITGILELSIKQIDSPWYIRIGKGDEANLNFSNPCSSVKKQGNPNARVLVLTTGVLVHEVKKFIEMLSEENQIQVGVIHFLRIDQIDYFSFSREYEAAQIVYLLEEHFPFGGLFSRILHSLHSNGISSSKLHQRSLAYEYPHKYGNQQDHFKANGLDYQSLLLEIGDKLV